MIALTRGRYLLLWVHFSSFGITFHSSLYFLLYWKSTTHDFVNVSSHSFCLFEGLSYVYKQSCFEVIVEVSSQVVKYRTCQDDVDFVLNNRLTVRLYASKSKYTVESFFRLYKPCLYGCLEHSRNSSIPFKIKLSLLFKSLKARLAVLWQHSFAWSLSRFTYLNTCLSMMLPELCRNIPKLLHLISV